MSSGAGAVFSFALTLFLVRALGTADYGVLALAVSVGTLVLVFSDLGISVSTARFVAESPYSRMHAAGVLRTGLALKLIAGLLTALALLLLAPVIADAYDTPELTLPLRLMAVAAMAQGLSDVFFAWFTALGRISLNLRCRLVGSSTETMSSVCIVLLGGGAAGAVAGRAIGFASAGLLAAFLAVRTVGLPALRNRRAGRFPASQIAKYGFALLIIDGAFILFDRTDVLIIGAVLGTSAAGVFDAAFRIIALLKYPVTSISAGFAPRLAEGRRLAADSARFVAALRYSLLLYLLLAVPTLVWAGPIVKLLLGQDFAGAEPVLRALAPVVVISGLSPILASGVNYLGEARRRIPLAIAALAINVIIDLLLVSRIGIVAGAIGTGVAYAVYTGGHLRICQQALEVRLAGLLTTFGRGVIAAALAALVLLAFGTSDLSVFAWIAGTVLATAVYVGTLLVLRELSVEELRAGSRLLGRRLRPAEEPATAGGIR